MNKRIVALTINGVDVQRKVASRMLLTDFIRDELKLTGTNVGCEHGVCGACTILLNGESVRSCLMLAVQADGYEIETVESLQNDNGTLNTLQQSFKDCHGLQCGFCTPGFLMTVTSFLKENEDPTEEEIREAISGNLCRCTGYANIVKSVQRTVQSQRTSKSLTEPVCHTDHKQNETVQIS
ncbi:MULTISPECIES: (2Fe-2S)-binding protein [unclassified Sporosarcina]|uniref:(2Fe-2S)-binding protein n=1 Tax=unclassified Sporosarcina TaxID=2647733 RepID=UPI000C1734EF|nr:MULTISPECIES: (2Fe-2S)-binding protein [unclassified Sporosarcina]PID15002.1 (2Fe-2S)-binding protein [Sporosarcina sp. P34]PID25230.1 (2Fe-2S)-binding protein [Sporosarcina sp. P7]